MWTSVTARRCHVGIRAPNRDERWVTASDDGQYGCDLGGERPHLVALLLDAPGLEAHLDLVHARRRLGEDLLGDVAGRTAQGALADVPAGSADVEERRDVAD